MATYSAYPTPTQVQTFLKGAGVQYTSLPADVTNGIPWQDLIDAAVRRLEESTGYKPFLSSGTDTTRTLRVEMPTRLLDLRGGLLDVPATLTRRDPFDVSATPEETLTHRDDYVMERSESAEDGDPYDFLRFIRPRSGEFAIDGAWGRFADDALPSDVFSAIRSAAAADAWPMLQAALMTNAGTATRPVSSLRQGDEQYDYATTQTERERLAEGWAKALPAVIRRYRRMVTY